MNTMIPQERTKVIPPKLESTLRALHHFLGAETSNENNSENVPTLTHELGNSLNIAQGFSEQIASTLQSVSHAISTMTSSDSQTSDAKDCLAQLTEAQAQMNSVLKRHQHLEDILDDIRSQSSDESDALLAAKWFEPLIF